MPWTLIFFDFFQGINVEQSYEGGTISPQNLCFFFSFTGVLYPKSTTRKLIKDIFWCKTEFPIDWDHPQVSRINRFWENAKKLTLGHDKAIRTLKICIFCSFTGLLQSKLTISKLNKDIICCKIYFLIDWDHAQVSMINHSWEKAQKTKIRSILAIL